LTGPKRQSFYSGLALFFFHKGDKMDFHKGDPVMHWTYGLGEVIGLEERALSGEKTLYYAVKVRDMTVWVPADGNIAKRLRHPTKAADFKRLFAILSDNGKPLPEDRQERKLHLVEQLKDGRAESLCHVIRDLFSYQQAKTLNENEVVILKRAQNALLSEWGYSLSIPEMQAESDLRRMLTSGPVS
jgi:RNA polymerase-interacting CarD/CdnL/TRCF family regulator